MQMIKEFLDQQFPVIRAVLQPKEKPTEKVPEKVTVATKTPISQSLPLTEVPKSRNV
jgi:hypothetical protein